MSRLADLASGPSPLAALIGNLDARRTHVIEVPGQPDQRVGIWNLTQSEVDAARAATRAYLRGTLKLTDMDLAFEPSAYDDNLAIEQLALALRDADQPTNQWARNAQELRDRLSPKQLGALHQACRAWAEECNPLRTIVDLEREVDELCELLGKGQPVHARLSSLDGISAHKLLPPLVARLAMQMNAPSSPLSSPSDSDPPSTDS